MKQTLKIVIPLALLGLIVMFRIACTADVDTPRPNSIRELKTKTLAFLNETEQAFTENRANLNHIRQLGVHINWLKGHMKTLNVGTDEQRRALQEILWQLSANSGGIDRPPADWRPDQDNTPVPLPIIKAGPIKNLIPQIRTIVESIPDSDLRPDIAPPRGKSGP